MTSTVRQVTNSLLLSEDLAVRRRRLQRGELRNVELSLSVTISMARSKMILHRLPGYDRSLFWNVSCIPTREQ